MMAVNMEYIYYPGCTLRTKAKKLDGFARKSLEFLGVSVSEPADWQCCGAVYPMAEDEVATRLSAVRLLEQAHREQKSLLTLCSACHHVIKRVNDDVKTNADIRDKANNYLELDKPYNGDVRVVHFLEMLRDDIGFDELKKRVVKPLSGRRVAAYYGCLLLRPSNVMQFDDPENPSIFEDFIKALGAEPVVFSYRNECCGGYCIERSGELCSSAFSGKVNDSAEQNGADSIISACPLCRYNLSKNAGDGSPKAYYFTELLAEALGVQ
jgi:heterodisulfide reductase subunit B